MKKIKITEKFPTPLLDDFEIFIDYLEEHEITLTKKNQYLRGKDLFKLNQLISNPVEDTTPRTPQESYNLAVGNPNTSSVGRKTAFLTPQDYDGIAVTEVKIGELGLEVGQEILYLFDYGDEWRFNVKLEKINNKEKKLENAEIIEEKGESPEQYGW